jgi:hypothetical protein
MRGEPYHRCQRQRSREGIGRSLLNIRRVDEQSHKNEMRAALRGDFERLRARRDDPEAPQQEEPSGDSGVLVRSHPGPADEPEAPQHSAPGESWLARLLKR